MNTQEREQLAQFLQQLTQAQAMQKDSEADTLIREACVRQPDATYLLVQRAMLLDHALKNSQTQITSLQLELDQARAGKNSGNFIDANAWGNTLAPRFNPPLQTAQYPGSPAPAPTPVPSAAPAPSAWGSGLLGNIASTAVGVVAGGFLFQGIEHLIGNHGSGSGLMNGLSGNESTGNKDVASASNPVDDSADSAGLFDTSSVDDFIANDTDDLV